jgi:hypothetical protein
VARHGRQRPEPSLTLCRRAGVVGMRSRASGVARLENLNKGIQDRIAQRNNKGKFPDVQPRSRGSATWSATLPRHARRHADTPTRLPNPGRAGAQPYRRHARRYADTPTRRHASPTPVARERNPTAPRTPRRRYVFSPKSRFARNSESVYSREAE